MNDAVTSDVPAPAIVTVPPVIVATAMVPEEYPTLPANTAPVTPVTTGDVKANGTAPYVLEIPDHTAIVGVACAIVTAPAT